MRWHRQGFALYWQWRSRPRRAGRPAVGGDIRDLIRQMHAANPLWGAPRIHGELQKLGITIAWPAFLTNQVSQFASIDFFTVQTATFRVLFVFVVLSHDRRRIVHVNVPAHPTAVWTARQFREAWPWDEAPRSPWQNPFVERVIGSIRRECLDRLRPPTESGRGQCRNGARAPGMQPGSSLQ